MEEVAAVAGDVGLPDSHPSASRAETIMSPPPGRQLSRVGLWSDQADVADPPAELRQSELSSHDRDQLLADKGLFYATLKRFLDIIGGLTGLIVLSPVILVVAAITKLIDGGPVFYRHSRVGLNRRTFTCYKFRTMVPGADELKRDVLHTNHHDDHRTFKVPHDPRVTRFGRWLRRASIDEVPQLWNVVKGDMSLVGPRPALPEEVERYTSIDMGRLLVKPGLTCIWQVSGRSELAFPVQLDLDLQYITNRSLWLDLKLILLTIPAVVTARGAY